MLPIIYNITIFHSIWIRYLTKRIGDEYVSMLPFSLLKKKDSVAFDILNNNDANMYANDYFALLFTLQNVRNHIIETLF